MSKRATRHVGYLEYAHFAVAEIPVGILLELDKGVPVIVLGSQENDDKSHTDALVQVTFQGAPAAIYVPWEKISLAGKREFTLIDTDGLPFESVQG